MTKDSLSLWYPELNPAQLTMMHRMFLQERIDELQGLKYTEEIGQRINELRSQL